MPHKHANALDVMSKADNYNNWIYDKIKPFIGKSILEIGCGIGNFTKFLANADRLVCIDLLKSCIEKVSANYKSSKNISFIEGDIFNQDIINKIKDTNFDTIVCLNVLEHIKEDKEVLEACSDLLQPHGQLVLMVPAMKFMFGSIDKSIGHERRYDKKELGEKLKRAGFKITKLYYFNSLGVLGWMLNNKILRREDLSLTQTLFYDKMIIPILSKIESFVSPSFGMSLIAIAEK